MATAFQVLKELPKMTRNKRSKYDRQFAYAQAHPGMYVSVATKPADYTLKKRGVKYVIRAGNIYIFKPAASAASAKQRKTTKRTRKASK